MIENRNTGMSLIRNIMPGWEVLSLVDLCVTVAIDNIRYLGDVGETDIHLLERILPHCTSKQLIHVENCSVGRDLSPVTDKLWEQFYRTDFGERSYNLVIERMKEKKVSFRWKQLYEAKKIDLFEAETIAVNRMKQLYEKADARKQSRQIRICEKVPPSIKKRSFGKFVVLLWLVLLCFCLFLSPVTRIQGQSRQIRICEKVPPSIKKRSFGSGPGYGLSGGKSNLMKKAKIDFLKSQEVKNLTAMRKNAMRRNYRAAPKNSGFPRNDSASASKHSKPLNRRF